MAGLLCWRVISWTILDFNRSENLIFVFGLLCFRHNKSYDYESHGKYNRQKETAKRTEEEMQCLTRCILLFDSCSGSTLSFYCNQFIFVIILNRQSVIRHIRHDIYQLMPDTNAALHSCVRIVHTQAQKHTNAVQENAIEIDTSKHACTLQIGSISSETHINTDISLAACFWCASKEYYSPFHISIESSFTQMFWKLFS